MTPALPGETPDPSATPQLDALLKEVEKIPRWEDVTGVPFVPLAPRLAAMLRVAVEALGEQAKCECCDIHPTEAQDALARIERIAAGDQGEP